MHLLDGRNQIIAGNRLCHIALRSGTNHRTDILRRIRHRQRQKHGIRGVCARFHENLGTAATLAAGDMHIKQHHIRLRLRDHRHRPLDIGRLPDDVEMRLQRCDNACTEHFMIVNDGDADLLFLLVHCCSSKWLVG